MRLPIPGAVLLFGAIGACARDEAGSCGPTDPSGPPPDCAGEVISAGGATDPLSQVHPLPVSLEQKVGAVRTELVRQGYQVARGYWTRFGIENCKYAIRTVGNCYGNNPAAPYILPVVPQWKDEFVDQKLHHALGALRRNYSGTFRLDQREALVVLAQLPPPGAYFGLQTYVFSREGTINTGDLVYQRVMGFPDVRDLLFALSPNPSRVMVFASIGNSNNNVVIEERSGAAFGEERFFIITPDAVMERAVSAALQQAGIGSDRIFLEPVPAGLVRLGLGPEADDLMTLIRYAMPEDSLAGAAWRQQLPLAVLRVRDPNRWRAAEPYAVSAYDARSADSELTLGGDLQALALAVRTQWGQPDAAIRQFLNPFSFVDLVGQHCLARPMNCLGDSQDTDTYRISPPLTIDHGEVLAVMSTLATVTGNATYVSLAVNRAAVLTGVANLSDGDLEGTATGFSGSVPNTDQFYLYYLARDCAGIAPCLELPVTVVPRGETIKLIQRNYIVPGTTRGADPALVLSPLVVVLQREP